MNATRRRAWMRRLLAGPGAFVAALLLVCGAAVYLPAGAAGMSSLVVAAVIFPALWMAILLYALLDPRPHRAGLVILALTLVNGVFIAAHFLTQIPTA